MLYETASCIIKPCISLRQGSSPRVTRSPQRTCDNVWGSFDCRYVEGGVERAGAGAATMVHRTAPPQRPVLPKLLPGTTPRSPDRSVVFI